MHAVDRLQFTTRWIRYTNTINQPINVQGGVHEIQQYNLGRECGLAAPPQSPGVHLWLAHRHN